MCFRNQSKMINLKYFQSCYRAFNNSYFKNIDLAATMGDVVLLCRLIVFCCLWKWKQFLVLLLLEAFFS